MASLVKKKPGRPRKYTTKTERLEAHRLSNRQSWTKNSDERNAIRRQKYRQRKRQQEGVIGKLLDKAVYIKSLGWHNPDGQTTLLDGSTPQSKTVDQNLKDITIKLNWETTGDTDAFMRKICEAFLRSRGQHHPEGDITIIDDAYLPIESLSQQASNLHNRALTEYGAYEAVTKRVEALESQLSQITHLFNELDTDALCGYESVYVAYSKRNYSFCIQ